MFPIAIGAIALLGILTILSVRGGSAHAVPTPPPKPPGYVFPGPVSSSPLVMAVVRKLEAGEFVSIDELRDAMQEALLFGMEETANVFYEIILKRGGEPNPEVASRMLESIASKEQ